MAKKKKRSSKEKAPAKSRKKKAEVAAPREPNIFLRQVGSVLMFVVALFLTIGAFDTGGAFPEDFFEAMYTVLGGAAFIVPVALVYWGFHKLRAEEHDLPINRILSMSSLLILFSAWMHVAFVTRASETDDWMNGKGGAVGELVGGTILTILDKPIAAIMLMTLTLLTLFWTFTIPLSVLAAPFKRRERNEDTDLEELKAKSKEQESKGFK